MSALSVSQLACQAAVVGADYQPIPPAGARPGWNIWSAYRLGMRLKTGSHGSIWQTLAGLARLITKPAKLSRALTPIDLVRWREFEFAIDAARKYAPQARRALDIGSPKLLPLTLAQGLRGSEVVATDILAREVNWVAMAATKLQLSNVHARVEDARNLTMADESFDLVTSISVFEHIAPELRGEVPAVVELARVLAPGGVAIITVPFSRNYFAEYRDGDVYERSAIGNAPLFFQRFYDAERLQRDIIAPSGLELVNLSFIDERHFSSNPHCRVAHYLNGRPWQTMLFGPVYPLVSRFFLSKDRPIDRCGKPYLACLVLRKRTGAVQRLRAAG